MGYENGRNSYFVRLQQNVLFVEIVGKFVSTFPTALFWIFKELNFIKKSKELKPIWISDEFLKYSKTDINFCTNNSVRLLHRINCITI